MSVQINNSAEANEAASDILDYILEEQSPERIKEKTNLIKVEEALKAQKIIEQQTERQLARVLFITEDLGVLVEGSVAQQRYQNIALLFAEVHIMVVMDGRKESTVFRLRQNIWVYKVYGRYQFSKRREARSVAEHHLVFNDAVRPDIIIADNPFLNAVIANDLAVKLSLPWQLWVSVDVFDRDWVQQKKENATKQRIARKVFRLPFHSVRTSSGKIKTVLQKKNRNIKNIDVLPQHYNIEAYKSGVARFDVHDVYKDYVFIMLTEVPLSTESALHEIFSATRPLLLNPRMGLIVIGEGAARNLFQEKAKLLGVEKSVVFISSTDDLVSYYKTADVFLQADISEESEQSVLKAAGSGLPMVLYPTVLREELFIDGQTAYICNPPTPQKMTSHIKYLVNSNSTRRQMAINAKDVVNTRLEEDPTAYYRALRYHIESVLLEDET